MEIRWQAKQNPNKEVVKAISKAININETLAAILVQRGIKTYEEAERFFRPKLDHLHDPFLMKDMDIAVSRIEKAIQNQEKILVYGDYDVDGTTSVALVYSFLKSLAGAERLDYYIPDRYKEGYGISKIGVDFAIEHNFTLIVALDCGIRSNEIIKYASENKVDFIVCDHHLPGAELPKAAAILNPKRKDCEYPYKELSGCGIGYKLISALAIQRGLPMETINEYLDLVAVSIASDLVDMQGENRILAYYGIKKLNEQPCIGLQALMQGIPQKDYYNITDIVFGIGPRINAAGRMADAKAAVKVLSASDFTDAIAYAKVLQDRNTERKTIDSDITREAIHMIKTDDVMMGKRSTVVKGESWQKGVIGIVASRLVEEFYKPTIVFSENDGVLTGSARSVKDFDIHEAIGSCGDLVDQFGGHKYAAGLSLKVENFDAFTEAFEKIVNENISQNSLIPEIEYDAEINLDQINPKMLDIIQQMAPFGPGNMLPIFKTAGLAVNGSARILKDKHLKLTFKTGRESYDGIGFGLGHFLPYVANNQMFSACYSIEENKFNGRTTIQLRLRDIKS